MAVESKPLFHPEVIRQQVRSFNLPESVAGWQPKLQHWASLITSGRADDLKETALLPDFLTDIFCGLLGSTGPAGSGDTYTLSRERHVEADGKFADAVLGRFQKNQAQFVAVLEGKGARDPLDRPFAGRRMFAKDPPYHQETAGAPSGLRLLRRPQAPPDRVFPRQAFEQGVALALEPTGCPMAHVHFANRAA